MDDSSLEVLAARATQGDRDALESLIKAIRDDLYQLSIRFLGHPADAEDACQEVIVRIITKLDSFKGDSRFSTWAYRVAARHLMNYKRALRRREMPVEQAHVMLGVAVQASQDATPAQGLAVEEMKLACAHGMLLCLQRPQRMAYVLGVLLDLPGETAAAVLEIEPALYRKRLQRARAQMRHHLTPLCGQVDTAHPCRCERMVDPATDAGIFDPALPYASHPRAQALHRRTSRLLEAAELLRGEPRYRAPEAFTGTLRKLLDRIDELN